jgi:hypothetical protein
MSPEEVVREITRRAWLFGVAVYLPPGDHVMADNLRCTGYFDGDSEQPVLVCAMGADTNRWLGILLHEYCHLTQWVERAPCWLADKNPRWNEWIAGKSVANVEQQLLATQAMEADCERRTLRLIRELGAPVDVERYTRSANAYIHFHNTILETRKWFAPGKEPYNNPKVLALANPTFDSRFDRTPPRLAKALRECVEP